MLEKLNVENVVSCSAFHPDFGGLLLVNDLINTFLRSTCNYHSFLSRINSLCSWHMICKLSCYCSSFKKNSVYSHHAPCKTSCCRIIFKRNFLACSFHVLQYKSCLKGKICLPYLLFSYSF